MSAPLRLWDSQWVNIVNHEDCYCAYDKEEAVALAVKLTEQAMAKNALASVAELIEAAKSAEASLQQLVGLNRIPANNKGLRDLRAALDACKGAQP